VVHTRASIVEHAGRGVTELLGWQPHELVGRSWDRLRHPADLGADAAPDEGAAAAGAGSTTTATGRLRLRRADGTWRWVTFHARPLLDRDDRPTATTAWALHDAQAEVDAEEAASRAERRLAAILDATQDAIVIIEGDGTNAYANAALTRLLGWIPDEVRGTPFLERLHPEDVRVLATARTDLAGRPGASTSRRVRLRHRDGRFIPVEISATNLLTDESVHGLVATVRDLRAELEAQEQLAAAAARHRDLVEAIPDAVVVVEDLRIVMANEAARVLCGTDSADDLIGLSMSCFQDPEVHRRSVEYGMRFLTTGRTEGPFVAWMHRIDGTPVLVEATPARVPGSESSVLLLMRDIGERERLLAELAASEATNRFLADNSSDVLLRADDAGRIVYASSATLPILGRAASDVLGRDLVEVFHEDDREHVALAVAEAVTLAPVPPLEVRAARADGLPAVWVELTVRGVALARDPGDAAEAATAPRVGFHVTMRDVTDRREARLALAASERWLRTLLHHAPIGIFESDLRGACTYVNPTYCAIAGLERPEEAHGTGWSSHVHPDDLGAVSADLAVAMGSGTRYSAEHRFVRGDGEVVWVEVEAVPVLDDHGRPTSWLGTVGDITERRRLEHARFEATELFRSAFDNAPTGMLLTSVAESTAQPARGGGIGARRPVVLRANEAFEALLGRSGDALATVDLYAITHPDDVEETLEGRRALLAGEIERHHMELRHLHADGRWIWCSLTRSIVRDGTGAPQFMVAQLEDVTERRLAQDRAAQLASTDPLTGLANRRRFHERLEDAHERRDVDLAVVFVDLDHFKTVNDELGHDAGDELLEEVARALRSAVRPIDTVARVGGDEFAILVEGVAPEDLDRIAARLQALVDLRRLLPDGSVHRVTASIGVALRPRGTAGPPEPADLVRRADAAMYRAKVLGRARCVVDPGPPLQVPSLAGRSGPSR